MNFVLRAITLHDYPFIQSRMRYRASQHFYDVIEGEVGAPRKPIKIFVIQFISMERGEVSFFLFFFKWTYIIVLQRGKGAKTPTIQAEWF